MIRFINFGNSVMAKILGIGGIFFRGHDHVAQRIWYQAHLGIDGITNGCASFPWRASDEPERSEMTVWSIFKNDTDYFGPANPAFMINSIVDDLDGMLAELREKGAAVVDKVDESEYGRFGWVTDPEGNRIELWQPPRSPQEPG